MYNRSTDHWSGETPDLARSNYDYEPVCPTKQNSPEEVLGEVGLVLIAILGIIVAVNLVLAALHVV